MFESNRDKTFEYRSYSFEKKDGSYHVTYDFAIPGIAEFHPTWEFPVEREVDETILSRLIFQLGMVESISYWKCACPKNFYVQCGSLTTKQIEWWKKLFYNGLGEFMFKNNIEIKMEDFIEIHCEDTNAPVMHDTATYSGCLVPVGGGKDSVVTLELLKDEKIHTYCVNGNETTKNVISKCKNVALEYVAKRRLDPELLELNKQGYLNGHTPFSAIVAFSGFLSAFLAGDKYIALSNENSANESTVQDSFVNHQYSKTIEFENDFRDYIKSVVDSDIHYFSMLRPLNELQIAKLFARHKDYHDVFRSCNVGSKKGIWCCNCAKCLFVYIILSPFLSDDELVGIFGENLLNKKELENDFCSLLGINENKPFECVGTRGEVNASLFEFTKSRSSFLTDKYKDRIEQEQISDYLNEFSEENNLPAPFANTLKRTLAL